MENVGNDKKSVGPIIGIIIIVILVILGGLYFYGKSIRTAPSAQSEAEEEVAQAASLEKISSQSASDATEDISKDLNETPIDSLDSDFKDL